MSLMRTCLNTLTRFHHSRDLLPALCAMVAAALKNRAVILSGLTTGLVGYAIGNYLGITVALIVKHFTM